MWQKSTKTRPSDVAHRTMMRPSSVTICAATDGLTTSRWSRRRRPDGGRRGRPLQPAHASVITGETPHGRLELLVLLAIAVGVALLYLGSVSASARCGDSAASTGRGTGGPMRLRAVLFFALGPSRSRAAGARSRTSGRIPTGRAHRCRTCWSIGKEVDAATRRAYEDAMTARLQASGVQAAPSLPRGARRRSRRTRSRARSPPAGTTA